MGPSAIRIAGLSAMLAGIGYDVREVGTVTAAGPETTDPGDKRSRYLPEITEVCRSSHALVRQSLEQGSLPLILGGDHSLSIGTVAAVAAHYATSEEGIGVLSHRSASPASSVRPAPVPIPDRGRRQWFTNGAHEVPVGRRLPITIVGSAG